MGYRIEIHRAAAIVLAAVALTQFAACGTAPRIKPKPLTHWSNPKDCVTDYAAAVSGLAHDNGAATALLVDSIDTVWNCTTIPEGRYDATVVVRWSNGWQETALDVQGIDVAQGQTLIAKAFERDRGVIPASFSEVRVGSDPVPAAIESVPPGPALESQSGHAPATDTATPATAPEPQPEQSPSPAAQSAPESPHPAVTALKIAAAVVVIASLVVLTRGNIPLNFGGGNAQHRTPTTYAPRRTGPAGRPAADCCFVWIEDGITGAVIAGTRPVQN
jgi:hypothetical protein